MDVVIGSGNTRKLFTIATGAFTGIPAKRAEELKLQRERDAEAIKHFVRTQAQRARK